MTDTNTSASNSSLTTCGLLFPLVWMLRKPLVAILALLLRSAAALVMPALLVLGAVKAWQLAQTGSRKSASSVYPGDAESLTTRAGDVAPETPAVPI
jgi:hypothetical protein